MNVGKVLVATKYECRSLLGSPSDLPSTDPKNHKVLESTCSMYYVLLAKLLLYIVEYIVSSTTTMYVIAPACTFWFKCF